MIIQRETFIMLRNVSSGGYVRTMRVVVCLVVPSDSTRSTHLIGLFPAGMLVGGKNTFQNVVKNLSINDVTQSKNHMTLREVGKYVHIS